MLVKLKEKLKKGAIINGKILKMRKVSDGRFKEEENFEFILDGNKIFICKIFYGRKPHYREWVEMYNFVDESYFGSRVEKNLISLFYDFLDPGAKIFVEYEDDRKTFEELEKGIPEVLSRMGFLLFKNNFVHIKNFYFPEGFMEGGRKLKAEKPLNDEEFLKERKRILEEVKSFLEKDDFEGKFESEIYKRAEELLTISRKPKTKNQKP